MTAPHYFGKYLNDLVQKLNSTTDNLELEVRFQDNNNNIKFARFQAVKEFLKNKYGEPVITHTEDVKAGELRQTIQVNKNGSYSYFNINKKSIGTPIKDENFKFKLMYQVRR
jgi:hypothetical protein